MGYANNLQFVERSGLGLNIIDENVGTGDNAETSFDLDHDKIITGSYTLNHAASGSNAFTAMVETTHYTLDKDSGKILLTGAGVTELGTDILYATYWYTDTFTDSVITDFLATADDEIDKLTGREWAGPVSKVEYRDGRSSLAYPTTDHPYQNDWDQPDFIVLESYPIVKVNYVYFLNYPLTISKCFNYDLGTTTYTDISDNVNFSTEAPINLFDDAPATGDIVYFGSEFPFLGLLTNLSTAGVDNGTTAIDWEYWNGTAWADITETDTDTGASIFTASGKFTWTYPFGWAKNEVNSSTLYWIRGTLTDDYSTDPIIATASIVDSVNRVLEPRNYLYDSTGRVNFMNVLIPNGTDNIRIDYNYGDLTTSSYITELSILIASVKAYVNTSGGSYDAATSYTLGSKSVTIGEQYVNIREVIDQFKKRIKEILDMIGKRANVVAI